jgi:Na+-driven multidrug efflux pump
MTSQFLSLQAYFLACRAPRVPMIATAIAAVVNLFGDLLLCQGFGLGVRGAAAATTCALLENMFTLSHCALTLSLGTVCASQACLLCAA